MEFLLVLFVTILALLVCWCVFGALLQFKGGREVTLLFLEADAPYLEQKVRHFKWLRSTGISTGELLLVDCGMTQEVRKTAEILAKDSFFIHLVAEKDLQTYFTFTRSEHGTGI